MKRIAFVSLFLALLFVTVAKAQDLPTKPTLGQKITVTIPTVKIDVDWNRREGINTVYSAPAGWQILEFKDVVISKRQKASYTFNTVPSNSSTLSTTIIDQKFDELLQVAARTGKKRKYEGKIKQLRNDYEKYYKRIGATHSSIQTTGSVRGNNKRWNQLPGRLYMDLKITLVYAPVSDKEFKQNIEFLKAMIKNDTLQ